MTAVAIEDGSVGVFGLSPEGAAVGKTIAADARPDEAWRNLGGRFVGTIAAVPGPDRAVELFGRSEDGSVHHLTLPRKGKPQRKWDGIGGGTKGSLAALFSARTGLSVFAAGRDGEVLHKRRSLQGKWRPAGEKWEKLGVAAEGLISAEWIDDKGLLLAVVAKDETVRVLAWPGYPDAPSRRDWEVAGSVNALLNGEIAKTDA